MLSVSGLLKRYRGMSRAALNDFCISIEKNEIIALSGASGSGKTTTLRLIAGFERADDGIIIADGITMTQGRYALPPEDRNVGLVFQDYALFPQLTVLENVAFGLSSSDKKRRAQEMLAMAQIEELSERYPHEISAGQQQRVALVRALAPAPKVILLDEPFSNLDHACTHRIMAETRSLLKQSGAAALVVTHDRYEAFTLADRIAVLHEGNLQQIGTAEAVYAHPISRAVAEFSGLVSFLSVHKEKDEWRSIIGSVPLGVAVISEGTSHIAAIRPHQLTLTSTAKENAVVTDIRFLGPVIAVHVNITAFDVPLLIYISHWNTNLELGSGVSVQWAREVVSSTGLTG